MSGGMRYNESDNIFLVVIFPAVLVAWFLFTDRKISEGFLLYCLCFSGLLYSLSLYTGGSLSLASVISLILKIILAYLIIRMAGERFADTFIKVMVFLAVISLVGYISDTFQLFEGVVRKLPVVAGRGYDGLFYVFRDSYHPARNSSIFFEPGAYQGLLNAAIFMIYFANTNIRKFRLWICFAILTAALVTAFSTTGFLTFLVGFTLFLFKSKAASSLGKAAFVGLAFLIVGIFSAQFYTTIVVKMDDYLNPSEERKGWSAENRSFDAQTDLKIFKKHVFGLGYDKYMEEFSLIGKEEMGKGSSSNGVTRTLAMYGLPYSLFIFGSYYWAIRRLLGDFIISTGAFVMLMMFLVGESYYITSISSFAIIAAAFIFRSKAEKNELHPDAGIFQNN
jgi:hypothetical protein